MFKITAHLNTAGLDNLLVTGPGAFADATAAAANDVVGDIRANWSGYYPPAGDPGDSPAIRSGALDASVTFEMDATTSRATITVLASYAGYLEYGTAKMAARPFVRPALRRVERTLIERYRKVLLP